MEKMKLNVGLEGCLHGLVDSAPNIKCRGRGSIPIRDFRCL